MEIKKCACIFYTDNLPKLINPHVMIVHILTNMNLNRREDHK